MTKDDTLLRETVSLATRVKQFGASLGIEPSHALSKSTRERPGASRLWIWIQRKGTLALRRPMDLVLQADFSEPADGVPLRSLSSWSEGKEYSYYWRHTSEFESDIEASTITPEFARQPLRRKVEVILHEDLHTNSPFKEMPFHLSESLVSALGDLGSLAFFEATRDTENARETLAHVEQQRRISRELNALVAEMMDLFRTLSLEEARSRALKEVQSSASYSRFYQHLLRDQSAELILEAKVSHDFAYYGLYDLILSLYEIAGEDLKEVIRLLKRTPTDTVGAEAYIEALTRRRAP